jgi:hypothetical protein
MPAAAPRRRVFSPRRAFFFIDRPELPLFDPLLDPLLDPLYSLLFDLT